MKSKEKEIASVKSYFVDNAESWMLDAYEYGEYNYPVGFHRMRQLIQLIPKLEKVKSVIDVGCGGGHLAFSLAENGYEVLGVDQSEVMIEHAIQNLSKIGSNVASKVRFQLGSIEDLGLASFDLMTAMGVIGYFPNDNLLFETGKKVLKDNGYLVVSFRNKLFNLYSISNRTIKEAENGAFSQLVEEAAELYQQIDRKDVRKFIESLHYITGKMLEGKLLESESGPQPTPSKAGGKEYTSVIEARQTTPKQAQQIAADCGYYTINLYGIHPHITVPGLNELLPYQVYNRLSDSLIPLESTPVSLLWSSVFIGVFQKK